MTPAITPAQLADMLGTSEEQVLRWRRMYSWPSFKAGKTIRFTQEHVEQIIAQQSAVPKRADAADVVIEGQTKRSAKRAS